MTPLDDGKPQAGRVVVLGGGTGILAALRGLKSSTAELTAIVTVADDGGSSGRLRKDYHMLPPGDIRNCLVALSESDPLLAELFSYRFEDSLLRDHSFGNLFLAVLTRLSGEFRIAVEQARRLLGVRGKVLPSTDTRVVLVASHPDGTRSTGEQSIGRCGKPITDMYLAPRPPVVSDEIEQLVTEASLVVIGPGSLYTSIIPNLLVPGMTDAIARCKGRVVLVANLMTQPGETSGFELADHIRAIRTVTGLERMDLMLVNDAPVSDAVRGRYREAGAEILSAPEGVVKLEGVSVVARELVSTTDDGFIRHDAESLAAELLRFLREQSEEVARD